MTDTSNDWFHITNVQDIDSPALVVYPARIKENIRLVVERVADIQLLRPHVKTHKMAAVAQLQLQAGITKFKCATIAEAEMLGIEKAPDVLLAYQPVGPKVQRFIQLIKMYPDTLFSCLVDNEVTANSINQQCIEAGITLNVFLDLNVGMNRTGILPQNAFELFQYCLALSNINPIGLHGYDGNINDTDINIRQQRSDIAYDNIQALVKRILDQLHILPVILSGGSPSFATHLLRKGVEVSPGTFIFWDYGYKTMLPAEPYSYAALVISRVISIIDAHTICTDLGHKAVAAENPLPRVHFLNAPQAIPIGQSEEHLMLQVRDSTKYTPGDVLYGVPIHICPTVALYDKAVVIENNTATSEWAVTARGRKITV